MNKDTKVYKLKGVVQHYSWGGKKLLPELLKHPNPEDKPFAEYWMGAHENASSKIVTGEQEMSLRDIIHADPEVFLGSAVNAEFKSLPYLLKVLDVKDMLSIQVHPSKMAAALGYEQENIVGKAKDAPDRNYKDANHKPEMMVALGDFWLLHGFKSPPLMEDVLRNHPEFENLLIEFQKGSYLGLYENIMRMPQIEVNGILRPVLSKIIPLYEAGKLTRDQEDFWAARAAITFNQDENIDRGILSIYIFNLVHLKEGEAIFQDAGILHAYLEGWNMELMANSDNVLRGGLTNKYIDVPELLKHVRFEPVLPEVISGTHLESGEILYPSPAKDFQMSLLIPENDKPVKITTTTAEIFFVYKGVVELNYNGNRIHLTAGESIFVIPDVELEFSTLSAARIFRAGVPDKNY